MKELGVPCISLLQRYHIQVAQPSKPGTQQFKQGNFRAIVYVIWFCPWDRAAKEVSRAHYLTRHSPLSVFWWLHIGVASGGTSKKNNNSFSFLKDGWTEARAGSSTYTGGCAKCLFLLLLAQDIPMVT
jgi:hypothetical protein